jgi:hypothetical protein
MSTGKYSPLCPHANESGWEMFKYNCYGEVPADWNQEVYEDGIEYDEKTMFGDYDSEGFDSYGYSAFDADGEYVGIGDGIDRYGYTEMDYLTDSINGGNLHSDLQCGYGTPLTAFIREKK